MDATQSGSAWKYTKMEQKYSQMHLADLYIVGHFLSLLSRRNCCVQGKVNLMRT